MSYSLPQVLLFIVAYLSGLFAVAYLADRGIIPRKITQHPAIYVLSLGVFAGALATNGVFELAYRYGYSFLLYYMGMVLMFVIGSLFLLPLLRLSRIYQLSSIADVLTFRFRSERVGAAVTIAMCVTLLPLLALQIQAVADSVHILTGDTAYLQPGVPRQDGLALAFCLIIIVFAILFGTRNDSPQQRNTGLVTAIAFESLMKLLAMLTVFYVAVYQVFGGFAGLENWLQTSPGATALLEQPMRSDTTRSLLLLFFAGAVCMPHLFHMAFAENTDSGNLRAATWGVPLYLLLLSLPVLPILWAGMRLGHDLPVEYTSLALGLGVGSHTVSLAAFMAGLSAASATIIVTTLALANMCLTHLVLPRSVLHIDREESIYSQLRWIRRALITLLILGGYSFFVALSSRETLMQMGLVAFVGVLQFLPGIIATLYWPRANRRGLLSGLAAGLSIWALTMALPLTMDNPLTFLTELLDPFVAHYDEIWTGVTSLSLAANTAIFILVSLLSRTRHEEQVAAEICSMDNLNRPTRQTLSLHSAAEFAAHLAPELGEKTAEAEVSRALQELQFDIRESRPYALRRLRGRIEANLSGLLGPAVSHNIINRCIPFEPNVRGDTKDINLIERNLDRAQPRLTGLAADLDNLRRHYREILDNLPIGVLSAGTDGELLMWNRSMEAITGIDAEYVLGSHLSALPEPWQGIIAEFTSGDENSLLKREITSETGTSRWISLQKASIPAAETQRDRVILVEDITEFELLGEELVHSERLASIGRLAAGVAHEIGNPVTGIACLAQNLEYETDPQEIRHTADDILKQTERVTRIVESLVNFSHVGSSPGTMELRPCNLADCIDEAIHLLRLDSQATPVAFSNDCDRELLVLADSQRLLQVFINLLGNSRDACSDQDGLVKISARSSDTEVYIDVEDNGSGIPPEIQDQVLEPFFTTKDPGKGTGLGLALVYSIMEDMGGAMQLRSPVYLVGPPGTVIALQLKRGEYPDGFGL
jgi:PAS domain S-box-containing protein